MDTLAKGCRGPTYYRVGVAGGITSSSAWRDASEQHVMGDGGDRLLRAFPLVDFSDELPSIALSVGDGRAAPAACARTGLLAVGRSQVLWQLVHDARGAWQLVLGRLRLFKPYQDNGDGAEDGRRPGDLERACETSAVSVLLPGDYSGGPQAFKCCAAADPDGDVLVLYALLAADSGARLFRLELRLPPDAAPFEWRPAILSHTLWIDAAEHGRDVVVVHHSEGWLPRCR